MYEFRVACYAMEYHLCYCSKCDADWDSGPDEPCPDCGQGSRMTCTYSSGAVSMGDQGTWTSFGTARPWQEQWYQASRRYIQLRAAYQPNGRRGADTLKAIAEEFFEHCNRLKDWLKDDVMTSRRAKKKLEKYFDRQPSLVLCRDIANTTKHRGRNREGDRHAVVRRIHHLDGDSESADIEWWFKGKETDLHTEDALALADSCMAAWRTYLKGNNLRLSDVKRLRNTF